MSITRARLLRHAPTTRQGLEAAAMDVAQDLLLRHDLTPEERVIADLNAGDRALVLHMLATLPATRLTPGTVW